MDLQAFIEGAFKEMGTPGTVVVVNHLRSERGKEMNGRRAVVVGVDPPKENRRIRVRLLNKNTQEPEGNVLQLKLKNLVRVERYTSEIPSARLSNEETIRFLKKAMKNARANGNANRPGPEDNGGSYRRFQLIKSTLSKAEGTPTGIECQDPMKPEEDLNFLEKLVAQITPACAGDGFVDFTRFGEGIIPGGEDECAVCVECITSDLVRLPCDHKFHLDCVKPWFQEHDTCPTCREALINPWTTYVFKIPREQIQKRFDEWIQSGMCQRCQALNMENDPVVIVNDDGQDVAMPLSLARQKGFGDNYRSVQGENMESINIYTGN